MDMTRKKETAEQGKVRGARALAKAEDYAVEREWGYSWEPDLGGCIGCDCDSLDCKCSTGEPTIRLDACSER